MIDEIKNIRIYTYDDLQKFIPRIERIIRSSPEYKQYLHYIYETLQIRNCDYFTEWNIEENITFNIHHLITLYNLVEIVGAKLLLDNDYIYTFDVAKEVILLHFKDYVPVILLTQTIHEALHAGLYKIKKDSKSLNLGKYKEFVKEYKDVTTTKDIEI